MPEAKGKFLREKFDLMEPMPGRFRATVVSCGIMKTEMAEANRCPLWVKSGSKNSSLRCLLYPQKRTFSGGFGMFFLSAKS